jgi:hypothetical protein
MKIAADDQKPLIAKGLQAAEEKLNPAKGTDAQTIFDTEMEAIRYIHIVTPPRENTPGIMMVGNQNPSPIPPIRPGATAPSNNIKERFDYLEYYSKSYYNISVKSTSLVTES